MEGEVIERRGPVRLIIVQDIDPESPREDTNLGIMVCSHNRYNLGDRAPNEVERRALRNGSWPLLRRFLRRYEGAVELLPLGLYDHSGLRMYVGGGKLGGYAAWDSGTVGYIYATKETVETCGTPLGRVKECLEAEVEVYDQFLSGDVWGYVVEVDGDQEDSCWGYFGREDVETEGRSAFEAIASRELREECYGNV